MQNVKFFQMEIEEIIIELLSIIKNCYLNINDV